MQVSPLKMSIFLDSAVRIDLAASEDKAPKWHLLFPKGAVKHHPKGKLSFDEKTLKAMADNYAAEGKPERAVNFFHHGPSSVIAPIENKIAAGWIKDVELRETGLHALIQWTDRARTHILADELRYLSPEFAMSAVSKATGKDQGPTLFGVALLNDPFLTELPRVAASETAPSAQEVPTMNKLIELLKLAEGASEADVEKAVEAMNVQLSESATKLSEVQGVVTKLTEQVAELSKERDTLNADRKAKEVSAYVEKLVLAGKVTPAIRPDVEKLGQAHGIDAIKFFESATPVVSIGTEKGVSGVSTPADPKADAAKRVQVRLAELEGKGIKFGDALKMVKTELPTEFGLAYAAQ